MTTLAVTGSTGQLGGRVARGLAERGIEQRLLVRDLSRAPRIAGASVVPFSFTDVELATEALRGCDTVFMVSGSEAADRLDQHRAFVDAIAAAGVEHVVYTSFAAAAPDCTFTLGRDHYATEQHIVAAGLRHTFLRDNFYLDLLPEFAGEDGVIRGPAGAGRVAAVTRDDVAAAAVAVLSEPEAHRDATYDLTGPEALTLGEIAATVSELTGRRLSFHDETIEEAYASRLRWSAPQWQYDAWVSTYTAIAAGEVAAVSEDVRRLTGRPALGLREYLTRG